MIQARPNCGRSSITAQASRAGRARARKMGWIDAERDQYSRDQTSELRMCSGRDEPTRVSRVTVGAAAVQSGDSCLIRATRRIGGKPCRCPTDAS